MLADENCHLEVHFFRLTDACYNERHIYFLQVLSLKFTTTGFYYKNGCLTAMFGFEKLRIEIFLVFLPAVSNAICIRTPEDINYVNRLPLNNLLPDKQKMFS